MKACISRRTALRSVASSVAALSVVSLLDKPLRAAESVSLKGKVNHSVCKWCYGKIPLDEFCHSAKEMGLSSVELLGPDDWPTLRKHGLICAMCSGPNVNGIGGIEKAWNRIEHHEVLVEAYEKRIVEAAKAGYSNVICFSGNRAGLDDEKGLEHCAVGLKRIVDTAEKHQINVAMELLNSKVNHKYIAHYHTGGVPGRNEIDDTQEIYYPAVLKAIMETGFKGHVAQEFVPKRPDALASLRQGVEICDV